MTQSTAQAFRIKMAKQKAEAFLRSEGIGTLPVDPFAIAANRNISVQAKPKTADGVSGMLLRHGDEFGILYATHIVNEGFQRFSISHELGHYFLDGHIDHILPKGGIHTSHAGFVSRDPFELEADQFAVGLLMPGAPLGSIIARQDAGIDVVETLASLCRTSLTAAAIRYAELTKDAVAVVIATGATIDYFCLSDTLRATPEISRLRRGAMVPKGTVTARLGADAQRVASAERDEERGDIADWVGGARSIAVIEEVIGLGTYGKTLTILSCPSIEEETYREGDIDEEGDLTERWTPRFHR